MEANALALASTEQQLRVPVGHRGRQQLIVLGDADPDDALLAEVLVVEDGGLLDLTTPGQRDDEAVVLDGLDGRDRRHALIGVEADEVHDRAALGVPGGLRDLVDLLDVDLAPIAEEEHEGVGRGDEELVHPVVLLGRHAALALAASLLGLVGRGGRALDVAGVGDGHDHVLLLDQILQLNLCFVVLDRRLARIGVLAAHLLELVHDDVHQERLVAQDGPKARDLRAQLAVLLGELLLLEPREPRQPHLQDGLGLTLAERVIAVLAGSGDLRLGPAGAAHEGLEALQGQPHQAPLGHVRIGRLADRLDHEIHLGHGHAEALDDLALRLSLAELEARASTDHVAPVLDEDVQRLLQVEDRRTTVDDGEVDDPEGRLQIREAEQLVEDDLGEDVLLQLDHEAHAVPVALVAHLADALHPLVADELADLRREARLIHLIGDLGEHDLLALAPPGDLLRDGAGAHHHRTAPGGVRLVNPGAAVDDRPGREVRALDELHQIGDRAVRLTDQVDRRFDDLSEVVGRDVGGHAHRDAAGAVHQQVREPSGQDPRLLARLVEVGRVVDGVLLDVRQQLHRDAREATLRVAVGRRWIAVDGAEVALTVHEQVAHGEPLRHAHQGVVDAGVAVGMVVTQHLTDDLGALAEGRARREVQTAHRVEDAAMHGLQAVPGVGDGAPDDHAHRVIEVGRPHLLLDAHRMQIRARLRLRGGIVGRGRRVLVGHGLGGSRAAPEATGLGQKAPQRGAWLLLASGRLNR